MKDERMMRCPYCDKVFWITEEEQHSNETFECAHCHCVNAGSVEADDFGVLIGVTILDEQVGEIIKES